jgi:hypothetical protein
MQNKYEYKGLFYAKNDSEHKYYEGGAHFKYIDLFNILKNLTKKNSYSKNKKEIKKNSLSQGKNNNNSNYNMSTNKSKNKSLKNLLISENKTPINFVINFPKKKINNNEENKSLSKSKNLNNSHNYNNASKLGIIQFLNLKINNNKNLYNISDLENNSKLTNISRLKEKKISYDNINLKHHPKSRNSQDKRIKTKTKKDNSSLLNNNNINDYNENNYNYFFIEQKIDKTKEKNLMVGKKLINSQNNNNYLDYFKITKITPKSRGSLNKNTVMLNIRKLKNQQKSIYNVNDNSSINKIATSFIKKKKNRLSYDQNFKNSKIGYKFSTNTTMGEEINLKNKNNNEKSNKSPIINDSLYKKKNTMTLLTLNKFDDKKKNSNSKNKIENKIDKKINNINNNKVLKYINQYIIKSNGLRRQSSRNNFYSSYRNKYILNDLPKKIIDNTYNNANALNKNNEINLRGNYKMSSRNSIINNEKILKSLEEG